MGIVYELPAEPPVGTTVSTPLGILYGRRDGFEGPSWFQLWADDYFDDDFPFGWLELLRRYKRLQEVTV